MLIHMPGLLLLVACLLHSSSGFFWKTRFIYSTIDPEPSWDPEILEWFRKGRIWRASVSLGQVTGYWGEITTNQMQREQMLNLREKYVQECKTKDVYWKRMAEYAGWWFGGFGNILGHRWELVKKKFRNRKEWITAKFFLRDSKAILNMMNNVKMNTFYIERDHEYINERWRSLFFDELPHLLSMMKRITKVYINNTYPDGFFQTLYNDIIGAENKLREAKRRLETQPTSTTTKVYDSEFVENYRITFNEAGK